MFRSQSAGVIFCLFVFHCLLLIADPARAGLICTETPADIPVNLIWAGASPNDISTLNGSTSTPGHLQGRLKQCIPDGSVPGEEGVFEWLPPQPGDSAFFVGEINGPNSVALNGPNFNFVSLRMGNATFSGGLNANDVVIQDSQLESKMNFNGVSIFAQNTILIDSHDGEEIPDIDLTLTFDGGGLATPGDFIIGGGGRATTDITMTGSILTAGTLGIQPQIDGGGRVNLTLEGGQSSVSRDVLIGEVVGGRTDLTINTLAQVQWAIDSGFTTIGHSGEVNFNIQDGADVNTHETFIAFQPESTVKMKIEAAKWTSGNLVVGGFGDVDVTAHFGAELKSLNTTIGSFKNTSEGNAATVTLNDNAKWNIDGFLSIGSEGEGKLVLNDQSTVDVTGAAIVGVLENSKGTLEVHSGDTFNAHTTFEAGRSGAGEVTVFEGGHVDVDGDMFIGTFQHGIGVVTVKDGGRMMIDGNLNIGNGTPGVTGGNNGVGHLLIENGGSVEFGSSKELRIGRREGSSGFLTLTGPESQLVGGSTNLSMFVGLDGYGSLELKDGAKITGDIPQDFIFGVNEKGTGQFLIDGHGSLLSANNLIVGDKGEGDGQIVGGAAVEVVKDMTIGKTNKDENEVLLLGPGTTLKVGRDLTIGDEGNGKLTLGGESKLEMQTEEGKITLGKKAGSSGQLTLSGGGTEQLAPDSNLIIGDEGSGTLLIEEGARLTQGTINLGFNENSQGRIDIKGSGSLLNIKSRLGLSIKGSGIVTVSEGAELQTATENSSARTVLGDDDNSPTALLVVEGQGSIWEANAKVVLGRSANGVLNVKNGGGVDAKRGIILGEEENGFGEMTIGGDSQESSSAPAQVKYTEELVVGKAGDGAVHVSRGGLLTGENVSDFIVLGDDADSKSTVTVSDEGSQWTVGSSQGLIIGSLGSGTVEVNDAGVVEMDPDSDLIVGAFNPATKGTIIVDGINANARPTQFLTGKNISLGLQGQAELQILNGGEFKGAADTDVTTLVGTHAGGKGTVLVDGENSIWETGDLTVGGDGTAQVDVKNFAIVNSSNVDLKANGANSSVVNVKDGEWNLFNLNVEGDSELNVSGNSNFIVRGDSEFHGNASTSPLLDIQGAEAHFDVSNGLMMADRALVSVSDSGRLSAATMLVESSGIVALRGTSTVNISNILIVNNGLVQVSGQSLVAVGQNLGIGRLGIVDVRNDGIVSVGVTSAAQAGAVTIHSGGTLSGSGTIKGNLFVGGETQPEFGNGGKVLPGNSPGKLTIDGNFFLGTGAILGLEVAGTQAGLFDELSVSGLAEFAPGSIVEFSFLDGYLPKVGDQFTFVIAQGGVSGLSNENFRFTGIEPSFMYDARFEEGRFTLVALNDAQAAVPEPATFVLAALGLLGYGLLALRKKFRRN